MGRAPCCDKANVKKGPWSPEEDAKLKAYIEHHGTGGNWIALPQKIGLKRCGKSCRLRWLNYLRPNIKHGGFSEEEDNIICSLYVSIGSRWSIIAAQLPGRTDNDIKNYWNTRLKKKLLGKQRKEQQAHARRVSKQDMKRETEKLTVANSAIINQNPYWATEYSSLPMPVANDSIQDYDLNNQTSLRSLLVNKLEGVRYSQDNHQQHPTYTNTCDIPSTQNHVYPSTIDMVNHVPVVSDASNSGSGTYQTPSVFHGFDNFPNDLSELVCVNPQQMESYNYGMEYSLDMSNGGSGSSNTASTESASWGDMSSLVYSPLLSHYEGCRQGIPQHVAFEDCKFFGMQMQ